MDSNEFFTNNKTTTDQDYVSKYSLPEKPVASFFPSDIPDTPKPKRKQRLYFYLNIVVTVLVILITALILKLFLV